MEKGSYEMPPLETPKKPRRKTWAWVSLLALLVLIVVGTTIALIGMDRTTDTQSQPITSTSIPCAPISDNPGTYIPNPDQPAPTKPKSTDVKDYASIPEAPLAVVCEPASSVLLTDAEKEIIFADAVYDNCRLITETRLDCRLKAALGPALIDRVSAEAKATVEIDGKRYGDCGYSSSRVIDRADNAGRNDPVAGTIWCVPLG